jgi:hypothetical protein
MDPYNFRMNKTSENIILLFDEKGRRYFISADRMDKIIWIDNHHYMFHAVDITSRAQTMEELRKTIGIGK